MADKKNLNVEIIKPDDFGRFLTYMQNPNDLLADIGDAIETYREMKLDGKIDSLLENRKNRVVSYPYRISQAKAPDRVFQFVKDNLFENLNFERDIKELLSALEYGYAVSEVIWKQQNGYWIPDSLRNRKPERFRFKSDWTMVLGSTSEVLDQPYKFLVYRNRPEAENPYGTSELSRCYWPWSFKRAGFEFWLMATEMCGAPSIIAVFEAQDERKAKEDAKLLSEQLSAVAAGSGAALANVKEVKALEMSGVLQDFQVLINTCNAEISYSLSGQSLATAESEHGTRAQAEVHDDTFDTVAMGDAAQLQGTLQQLINWMVELNFGAGVPAPKGEFDLEKYASFEQVMNAVEKGVPVSRSSLYSRYGLPEPKDDKDIFTKQESPQGITLNDQDPKKKLKIR